MISILYGLVKFTKVEMIWSTSGFKAKNSHTPRNRCCNPYIYRGLKNGQK